MMAEPSSDREDRVTEARRLIQPVLDLKDAIIAAGVPVEIVSTGETWSYDVAGEIPGVTEIQGGTYLVMETGYDYMSDFQFAGKVLTTIISKPRQDSAVGDAGARAVGGLKGLPRVEDRPGVTAAEMDADRIVFRLDAGVELEIGGSSSTDSGPAGRHGQPLGSLRRSEERRGGGGLGHPGPRLS